MNIFDLKFSRENGFTGKIWGRKLNFVKDCDAHIQTIEVEN